MALPKLKQDVLNNEWAVFMGDENASKEVMISTGGLVNPRYNRENNPLLQSKKAVDSTEKQANGQGQLIGWPISGQRSGPRSNT